MAIPIGNLQFETVEFNYEAIATVLERFVGIGSERSSIKKSDITVISRSDMGANQYQDVASAITGGTKLFDALAYFSLPANNRPLVLYEPLETGEHPQSLGDISRAAFYVFMWALIRGRCPSNKGDADHGPVPGFLSNVMGFNDKPDFYAGVLASFDIAMMGTGWVKHIHLENIGQEAQNRLALGVAGYRVPAAIVYIPWRQNLPANVLRSARAVRRFVRSGMTWDCYSGTRSGAFLDSVKNFNKNVENLLLDIATTEHIAYFVDKKMLAVTPVRRPQFNQYLTWTDATFGGFTAFIFGRNTVPDTEDEQHSTMEMITEEM